MSKIIIKNGKMRIPIKKRGFTRWGKFRLKKKFVLLAVPVMLLLFFIMRLWGLALVIFILIIAKERMKKKEQASAPIEKGAAQKLLDEINEEEGKEGYAQNLINEIGKGGK